MITTDEVDINEPDEWAAWLRDWTQTLEYQYSPSTAASYRRGARQFLDYLARRQADLRDAFGSMAEEGPQ